MLDYLNTQEKEHLNALIALALENFVLEDEEVNDEYYALDQRRARIAAGFIYGGEPELAMEYMVPKDLTNYDSNGALRLMQSYMKSGNQIKSIEWEKRCFELVQQEPDFYEGVSHNSNKHFALCSLAENAFERGDLVSMEEYLALFSSKQSYHDIAALSMMENLLHCGKIELVRDLICFSSGITFSHTSRFSKLPILKALIAGNHELEFWALAGTCGHLGETSYSPVFYCGIDYAVDLNNMGLAFRILQKEAGKSTLLIDSLCDALIKNAQEAVLRSFIAGHHYSFHTGDKLKLRVIATYARVGWKNDREFILEKIEPFLDPERVIEDSEKSWIAQTCAWLNHWDGPTTIESLNLIPKLKWEALVEPCIVHANQTLQDKLFEIAGKNDGWKCNLLLEWHKSKRGLPNELEAHYYGMLDQMRREAGTWAWNSLSPVLWFLKHEWKDLSALEAFFTFVHEKGANLFSSYLGNHAFELTKAGRIADAIRHIPFIDSSFERLSAISNCISGYLDFKRRSSS